MESHTKHTWTTVTGSVKTLDAEQSKELHRLDDALVNLDLEFEAAQVLGADIKRIDTFKERLGKLAGDAEIVPEKKGTLGFTTKRMEANPAIDQEYPKNTAVATAAELSRPTKFITNRDDKRAVSLGGKHVKQNRLRKSKNKKCKRTPCHKTLRKNRKYKLSYRRYKG